MKTEDTIGVALTKEACPICGIAFDGPILMNRTLSKKKAEDVKSLHGKIIGFRDTPCDSCNEMLKQGTVLVGVDTNKTDDAKNPWRTGHMWCVKKEFADKLFVSAEIDNKDAKWSFIDIEVARQIGLPLNIPENDE